VLHVECTKCGRGGHYGVARLIAKFGRKSKLKEWLERSTATARTGMPHRRTAAISSVPIFHRRTEERIWVTPVQPWYPRGRAMADRPRTFAELVAAMNPDERARLEAAEHYDDHAVKSDFHAQVWLLEDRDAPGDWRVEYRDDDGACYVTIFCGPAAGQRARGYFHALQTGRLSTIRVDAPSAAADKPQGFDDGR
jgi:hypothetical protein